MDISIKALCPECQTKIRRAGKEAKRKERAKKKSKKNIIQES